MTGWVRPKRLYRPGVVGRQIENTISSYIKKMYLISDEVQLRIGN